MRNGNYEFGNPTPRVATSPVSDTMQGEGGGSPTLRGDAYLRRLRNEVGGHPSGAYMATGYTVVTPRVWAFSAALSPAVEDARLLTGHAPNERGTVFARDGRPVVTVFGGAA